MIKVRVYQVSCGLSLAFTKSQDCWISNLGWEWMRKDCPARKDSLFDERMDGRHVGSCYCAPVFRYRFSLTANKWILWETGCMKIKIENLFEISTIWRIRLLCCDSLVGYFSTDYEILSRSTIHKYHFRYISRLLDHRPVAHLSLWSGKFTISSFKRYFWKLLLDQFFTFILPWTTTNHNEDVHPLSSPSCSNTSKGWLH